MFELSSDAQMSQPLLMTALLGGALCALAGPGVSLAMPVFKTPAPQKCTLKEGLLRKVGPQELQRRASWGVMPSHAT